MLTYLPEYCPPEFQHTNDGLVFLAHGKIQVHGESKRNHVIFEFLNQETNMYNAFVETIQSATDKSIS